MDRLLDKPALKAVRDTAATYNAVRVLAVLILTIGPSAVYLVRSHSPVSELEAAVAGGFLVVVMSAGLILWYYLACRFDPPLYRFVQLEGLLVIEPAGAHHRYTNIRRGTVRARRNNVRFVEHRSHWTGTGSRNRRTVESLISDHQLFASRRPEEDGRLQLSIYLGEPLGRGEEVRTAIREVFEDNLDPMHPYYRKGGGRYPTRNLTVTVRFLVSEDPSRIEGLIWNNDRRSRERHLVGRIAFERRPDPATGTVDYTVTVPRPKRYHSYGLRWAWSSGPGGSRQVQGTAAGSR